MANVDMILEAGLQRMVGDVRALELCAGEPATLADARRLSFACKDAPRLTAPFHRTPTGMAVKITAFTDGKCAASGTVTHWALCGPSCVWAVGALADPVEVFAGALFEFPETTINLPGALA